MNPEPELWSLVIRLYGSTPSLLAWPVASGAQRMVEALNQLSAPPPMLFAARAGSPLREALKLGGLVVLEEPQDADFIREFRSYERRMADPDAGALEALDAWDPGRAARVLVPSAAHLTTVAGRPVYGAAVRHRRIFEDKTRIDALWDELEIRRAPSVVVPLGDAADAAARLDTGDGTVWAGDNTTAIEGGAIATRHVHDPLSRQAAVALLHGRCRAVRVMPFLRGIPCSVHAIVLHDGVVVLRPVEQLTLRDPRAGAFVFCGCATTWDPPRELREEMRAIARRVGAHLGATLGYRGALSIDGVATAAGFVPTELNARFSGGLSLLATALPGPPLELVDYALRAGETPPVDAAAWEQRLLRAADRRRVAHVVLHPVAPPDEETTLGLERGPSGWTPTAQPEPPVTVTWFTWGEHGRLRLDLDPLQTPVGAPLGPAWADLVQRAAEHWSLAVPDLIGATEA